MQLGCMYVVYAQLYKQFLKMHLFMSCIKLQTLFRQFKFVPALQHFLKQHGQLRQIKELINLHVVDLSHIFTARHREIFYSLNRAAI